MTEYERLEELLQNVERVADRDPVAALAELERGSPELRERPEARLLEADLIWETAGAAAARALFASLVADEPDYADARHLYGCLLEELGEEKEKIEQFLEVLRLDDVLQEELEGYGERELEDLIVSTAEQALERLPAGFRERLSGVPLLVERRPDEHLVAEGFDPRALGLFDGQSDLEQRGTETAPSPTRIVLYSMNLLAESVDEEQLCEEVETTVLHEIGHYFGLDEDDLDRIGLG